MSSQSVGYVLALPCVMRTLLKGSPNRERGKSGAGRPSKPEMGRRKE